MRQWPESLIFLVMVCVLFRLQWVNITVTSWWARWPLKPPASRLFRRRSKKASKLRVTGLCGLWDSPGTGEFPAQMASNMENVSIWWRHHGHWELLHARCWNFRIASIYALITLTSHDRRGVSNYKQLDCLFNSLFRSTKLKYQSSFLLTHWGSVQWQWQPMDSPHKGSVLKNALPSRHDVWIWWHNLARLKMIVACALSIHADVHHLYSANSTLSCWHRSSKLMSHALYEDLWGQKLGLYSLCGKTTPHQISWSLEIARLDAIVVASLWNLTGISATLFLRCLSNFRVIANV